MKGQKLKFWERAVIAIFLLAITHVVVILIYDTWSIHVARVVVATLIGFCLFATVVMIWRRRRVIRQSGMFSKAKREAYWAKRAALFQGKTPQANESGDMKTARVIRKAEE